jgi:DNA-binding transcriptional LysR family regulator
MTLWQLKTFATVAREGSFTKAGKALNISQPSVSSLVIGLQKELGARLFDKLGMKPHLTEAGRRVLRLVEKALATIDKIPEEIDEVMGLKKGNIRVGGSVLAAVSFLTVATQAFKKEHPGIEVIMKIERSEGLVRMLLEGELDVAITILPGRSPRLVSEPFRKERVVVIAPPKHPLTRRRTVPLKLLAQEPLIGYEKGILMRNMIEKKFDANGLSFVPAVQIDFNLGGRDAVRSAVANGLGIGFLPKSHVEADLKARRIKTLNVPELNNLGLTMHLTVPKKQNGSPLTQEFIQFLRMNYRASGGYSP